MLTNSYHSDKVILLDNKMRFIYLPVKEYSQYKVILHGRFHMLTHDNTCHDNFENKGQTKNAPKINLSGSAMITVQLKVYKKFE